MNQHCDDDRERNPNRDPQGDRGGSLVPAAPRARGAPGKGAVLPFLIAIVLLSSAHALGGDAGDAWVRDGKAALAQAKKLVPIDRPARNVLLFIGDGMGVSTVTAARILEGQQRGNPGEENLLSFERFPWSALIKTYNTNQQTPDSAGTMSAIVTGVKTKAGVLSVDDGVVVGDASTVAGNARPTILELAEKSGRSTGVVTTTRVTHATPAACYAHCPDRDWECDADLPAAALEAKSLDIARQLIGFPHGNGLEVALGGGRLGFLPETTADPEDLAKKGRRKDGRDLTKEWLERPRSAFVWNLAQFNAIDIKQTDHLLGLFEPSHMQYETERASDAAGEPSLTELTVKAIELLSRNENGYFLMVEGGRIDHGHHACNAYRALTETIEFARAVHAAVEKTKRDDTLILVTADHSHVFTFGGYATRGNPVLGKVVENDPAGRPGDLALDGIGLPYTAVAYANGPGYSGASKDQCEGHKSYPHAGKEYKGITKGRPDLTSVETQSPTYMQECTVPLSSETHGGEDVVVYADGPMAHLIHGVQEQNYIFYVMAHALGVLP